MIKEWLDSKGLTEYSFGQNTHTGYWINKWMALTHRPSYAAQQKIYSVYPDCPLVDPRNIKNWDYLKECIKRNQQEARVNIDRMNAELSTPLTKNEELLVLVHDYKKNDILFYRGQNK